MQRRDFIKTAGLAAGYVLTWNTREAEARKRDEHIIVIGAGMAGLTAARELRSRGYTVTILEARDRIGGRIWTDRSLGTPIDLGASWIHGTFFNPVSKLARKADAKTLRTDYDDLSVYDYDGRKISESDLEEYGGRFERLLRDIFSGAHFRTEDVSIAAAILGEIEGYPLTDFEQRLLDWMITSREVSAGVDLDELSLQYIDADDGYFGSDKLFPNGYDQVIQHVAQDLDITLNEIVEEIQYSEEGVAVRTDTRLYEADMAVLTVPLGVLKNTSIRFEPGLPEAKVDAINRLGMGALNKIALKFPEKFWDDSEFLGYTSKTKGEYPEFLNWHHYSSEPVLMAFTGGTFARENEQHSDAEITRRIMDILRSIYGRKIPDPLQVMASRWHADPFANGSYSHIPVGAESYDYELLWLPVKYTLFFAGEATIPAYYGTVHGAFLSGLRTAKTIATL